MSASPGQEADAAYVQALLQQSSPQAQIASLQEAGLLNQQGLSRLLDVAMELARSHPGQAYQLTLLCADLAIQAGAPALVPKATYIRAQTYAINGELNTALELIQVAHEGYMALGEELPALRTNLGLMHVLIQQGRHQEVLDVGHSVLQRLDQSELVDQSEAQLIATLTHNNLGICYRRMGRYEEALQALAAAEANCIAGGFSNRLADIGSNRGIILMYLGRVSEALAAFKASAVLYAEAGLTLLHAQTLINIGEAHLLLGNYTLSLDALAQAHDLLVSLDARAEEHLALLHRAEVYLALNLYPEALADYHEVTVYYEQAAMPYYQARALWGMGAALMAEGQLAEAEKVLAEAAALFASVNNVPMLSSVMLEQATLQAAQGEGEMALAIAQRAQHLVNERTWPVQQCYVHMRLADLLMPDVAKAELHLQQAQTLSESLALPHLRYRLEQRWGQLRQRQGRHEEAAVLLASAVAKVERLRGAVAEEAMRTSFLSDKLAPYQELLRLYLERMERETSATSREALAEQAFAIAEQAKSRVLIDLLTGVVKVKPALPDTPDLRSRLQALQADLNAVYNELLGSGGHQEQPARQSQLQMRARELEQAIGRLRLRAEATAGDSEPFSAALSFETICSYLSSDLPLLAYHTLGEEIIVFACVEDRIHVVRRVSTVMAVQELLQRLAIQWDRFRAGTDFVQRHMERLEQSAQRILAALHQELIAPVLPYLHQDGQRLWQQLAIVPHGLLHQIPFHALFDGKRYLLEQFELSYAPSATVLALCQQQRQQTTGKALIMAVSDPLIPAVTAEAQTIAQHLPGATIQADQEATVAALQTQAPGADILHLACHGLFRADNSMFSALKLYDGWLTAADILHLKLNHSLVTLSACESGRGMAVAGDEVVGLTRAFLGAGAATLVVSLWVVQDATTAELMADWYTHLQQQPPGRRTAALRAAQLNLKAHYPHPYYWAPFVLVGQR